MTLKRLLKIMFMTCLLLTLLGSAVSAHSGRTDANGGHNCSAKSKEKGLCTGYHYHNSGSSSTTKTTKSSTSTKSSTQKSNKQSVKQVETKVQHKESTVKLYVNDELVKLTNKPLQKNNANYFPVRLVASAIEAKVSFDSNKGTITISKDGTSISIDTKKTDVIVKDNVTYAPIRSIIEGLKIDIKFDKESNSIYLTYE